MDEGRQVGRQQHPEPENQDNQRMIDQPRESLLCNTKKNLVFLLEKGNFLFRFECLPLFLLSFFLASPFFIFSLSLNCGFVCFFLEEEAK